MASVLTFSESLLKTVFFVLNFCLWACGLVVIASTVYSLGGWEQLREVDFFPNNFSSISYRTSVLLFLSGLLLSLLGGLGCFGSCNDSPHVFYSYSAVLVVLFAVEAGALFYLNNDYNRSSEVMSMVLDNNLRAYFEDKPTKESWDFIQNKFSCCGGSNYTTWFEVFHNKTVPVSCCVAPSSECASNPPSGIYSQNCSEALWEFVNDRVLVVTLVGLVVALTEWLCIVTSCCIGNAIYDRNPIRYRRLGVE